MVNPASLGPGEIALATLLSGPQFLIWKHRVGAKLSFFLASAGVLDPIFDNGRGGVAQGLGAYAHLRHLGLDPGSAMTSSKLLNLIFPVYKMKLIIEPIFLGCGAN